VPQYPGYGAPGYPTPGYPTGRSPEASSLRGQAITSLILNILAVVFCCGLASIGGAIMAGMAIGRVDTDLPVARRQLAWSWGLLAANLLIALVVAGIFVAALGSRYNG
jgi:branched-subunit amino acid ABC-type transport system permease component